jgi:hypothetical protein
MALAGGLGMEQFFFFCMCCMLGTDFLTTRVHLFYDDAAAPRVETCLACRLRKQVDPKTDWGAVQVKTSVQPVLTACQCPIQSFSVSAL